MQIPLISKSLKCAAVIAAGLIVIFAFYSSFFNNEAELPKGCDAFAYLNMAKSISQGNLFTTATLRPFDSQLISYLEGKYPLTYYNQAISPYCYHVDPHTHKIIDQYPVGMGLALSVIPIYARGVLYPAAGMFFFFAFVLFAFWRYDGKITWFRLSLAIIASQFLFLGPLLYTFQGIYSAVMTYGMLVAAGYLLRKNPGASLVLAGLSSIFRIANVIFFAPILVVYILENVEVRYFLKEKTKTAKEILKKTLAAAGLFLAGYSINFIYVWALLGNPFYPTYQGDDLRFHFGDIGAIAHNLSFYIFQDGWLFASQIITAGLIFLLALSNRRTLMKWFFAASGILIFNYAFFAVHSIVINYYPYASGMLLFGICGFLLEDFFDSHSAVLATPADGKKVGFYWKRFAPIAKWGICLYALGVLIYFCSLIQLRQPADAQQIFQSQAAPYIACFSNDDVVWADLYAGTVEYVTSKAGFKYSGTADSAVVDDIMVWLNQHGYRQAVFDEGVQSQKYGVKQILDNSGLHYQTENCPGIGDGTGTVYDIIPQSRQ